MNRAESLRRAQVGRWLALVVALFALVAVAIARVVPAERLLNDISFSRVVTDSRGRLLRLTLSGDEKLRRFTALADISPVAIDAVLLHEDQHFFLHPGVDPIRLAKAAVATALHRGHRQGGSTLSMQVARRLYGIDSRTLAGKFMQIAAALWIEARHSKQEILEAYLNLAPYGGNIEGIGAASAALFGVPPARLGLNQALTLALLPQSPAARVIPGRAPELSSKLAPARARLLARYQARHPGVERALAAIDAPANRVPLPFLAPHFVEETLAAAPPCVGRCPDLRTTLDLTTQRVFERVVESYVEARRPVGIDDAAAMLVDARDGSIEAEVGSPDFFDADHDGQVNALRARRSPGSTVKPFIYALALDQGLIHPATLLKDSPVDFAGYDPENFDQTFVGPLSARDALVHSRNVPALRLANQLRVPGLYGFLQTAGAGLPRPSGYYGLSVALGGAELTGETLAMLYTGLASGGRFRPLRRLTSDPKPEGQALLSPEAAWMTLDMLQDNPPPNEAFRRKWTLDDRSIAWKTGTSNGFRDAWAAGVLGDHVLVVWVGHPDGRGDSALVGREMAGPLFFQLAQTLKAERGDLGAGLPRPRTLAKVPLCALSGGLPTDACPRTRRGWFWPGVSPIAPCEVHRKVKVDPATGERLCAGNKGPAKIEVDEFWSSDLLRIFAEAGLPRRQPPKPGPNCSLDALAASGLPPEIVSPMRAVSYAARASGTDAEIPLVAAADADVRTVSWFLGERFLGSVSPRSPLIWSAEPGNYTVRAVDDHGRSTTRALVVTLEK